MIVSMSDLNLNLIFQKLFYSSIVILQYVISSYFIYLLIIYYSACLSPLLFLFTTVWTEDTKKSHDLA